MRIPGLLALAAVAAGCDRSPAGDTPGPDAPRDAPAVTCGTRGAPRGMSKRDATVAGLHRTYLVYLPAGVPPSQPVPLVYVHHGYTMSGQNMVDATAYTALADTEHIAIAFPDGQNGPGAIAPPWNVGTDLCPTALGVPPPQATGDDFAFLDAMRADIAEDQCLDADHVFVTGFSMGGYFSHHAGCMKADIRAVAPHSGGTHDLSACANPKKPIIMFHGLSDGVIAPGCNDPASPAVGGVVPAATAWAQHNGCSLTTQTIDVKNGSCKVYTDCPDGGQVELCTFGGMGHCWAGGPPSAGVFACPAYAEATRLEWEFFKQYAW
jgi:polyhydroxybutyrate depolymerase